MKPNDKAYREFMRVYNKTHVSLEAQIMASLTAAYAAQFQSEDYAGLVKELRDASHCHQCVASGEQAADALEAVLAERDDFAEQLALRSENGISKDLQEFLRKFKEDDSAAIRMFAQYRDLEIEMDSWKSLWEKTNAHMRQVEAERDALLARLAPVDDEALVEIMVRTHYGKKWDDPDKGPGEAMKEVWRNLYRKPLASIRPHIEAAERERCAKIAEAKGIEWDRGDDGCARAIAAAIRRGK